VYDSAVEERAGYRDYAAIYKAYATTGDPAAISKETGLPQRTVIYLLDHGLTRLQLPPIRVHAIDYTVVNTRLAELPTEQLLQDAPALREAITDRATKEAAAAQVLLEAGMDVGRSFLKLAHKMREMAEAADGIDLGEKLTIDKFSKLAVSAEKVSRFMDTIVRLSRFTAGEPERSIEWRVASMLVRLPPEAKEYFVRTGKLPPELRGHLLQAPIDADFTEADNQDQEDNLILNESEDVILPDPEPIDD